MSVTPDRDEAGEAQAAKGAVHPLPGREEAPLADTRQKARGVHLARRIEATVAQLTQSRVHARTSKKKKQRKKARKQLRKLITILDAIQHTVLRDGASPAAEDALTAQLDLLDDAVETFLRKDRPGKRSLRTLRKVARGARKALS